MAFFSGHDGKSYCQTRGMMYYSASMNTLDESLMNAVKEGKLLESSRTNIRLLLDGTKSPIAREAVEELAAAGEWQELNDRFTKRWPSARGAARTYHRQHRHPGRAGERRRERPPGISLRGNRLHELLQCGAGHAWPDYLCEQACGGYGPGQEAPPGHRTRHAPLFP